MTEREQIKDALKECEKKFFKALQECPLAVTLTNAKDHRYIEINESFERISGWNRSEVIGRTPFDIEIWVDPSQRVDFVKRLLSGDTVRNLDVRARLRNREVWIGLGYAALIEINGETCVLSMIADVTDVKAAEEARQAEAALSRIGRRLIQAHEEERASIARELHDYVERLVLFSINLDRVRQNPPESMVEVSQQTGEAKRQVEDLAMDIQSLSHRLHSLELEYLGLAAAAASFCKELSDQKNIKIDFSSEGITKDISPEVSLCLFRVLQEALQNAGKHSRSQGLQVVLRGGENELNLTVRDFGFETEDDREAPALEFAIMKERLKLVAGELSVESQRGRSTTIHARVALNVKTDAAEAAG